MVNDKPGVLATISSILGILGYILADIFTYSYVQVLLDEPVNFDQAIGQIFELLISLAFALLAALAGSFFALFGKIWKQSKLIVFISLLTYLGFLGGLAYLSISAFDTGGEITLPLVAFWVVALGILGLHLKGIQN